MEIRVYDANKQYWLHSRRLRLTLEGLEVSITIGEDGAKIMRTFSCLYRSIAYAY